MKTKPAKYGEIFTFVNRWNPYQSFVVKRKELIEWYETNGASAFYDGRLWKPKVEKLFAGMYNVTFIEV